MVTNTMVARSGQLQSGGRELASLGDKIKELRTRKGLGLREAARALGISHPRLKEFEAGAKASGNPAIPGRDLVVAMSRIYEFPRDVLLQLGGYPVEDKEPIAAPPELVIMKREMDGILDDLPDPYREALLAVGRTLRTEAKKISKGSV